MRYAQPLMSQQQDAASKPRIQPGKRNSLRQVVSLQQKAYEVAMRLAEDALRDGLDSERRAKSATAMGNLIKAWDSAEDRKRIIRGKPLPGSLRPSTEKKRSSRALPAPTPEES
jgi:hypothetical protein